MMTETLLSPELYQKNLDFWQRAWDMVKTPYTQMPDLDYIPRIPAALSNKQDSVLDLGCGSGWLSVFLARHGFKSYGVDVAEHAIELARSWASSENLDIEFSVQDICELEFPADSFGAIVANSIFEHLTYKLAEQCIASLKRVLKPGGVFIGCFDLVGTGPGEYFELDDQTHVYTDKGRQGMMLRCFSDEELASLFADWQIKELSKTSSGSRFLIASI
ncbi:MAG: class I SAM-dependent methyltransferase [Candidatus Obscuribacterales bacterium]|nr:class I SAM-dependent methyltransferase [Candidatus Obscuribacterales bacterium]